MSRPRSHHRLSVYPEMWPSNTTPLYRQEDSPGSMACVFWPLQLQDIQAYQVFYHMPSYLTASWPDVSYSHVINSVEKSGEQQGLGGSLALCA